MFLTLPILLPFFDHTQSPSQQNEDKTTALFRDLLREKDCTLASVTEGLKARSELHENPFSATFSCPKAQPYIVGEWMEQRMEGEKLILGFRVRAFDKEGKPILQRIFQKEIFVPLALYENESVLQEAQMLCLKEAAEALLQEL